MTPLKFDPNAVQALLLQVRRDTVGSNRTPFIEGRLAGSVAPADIDHMAASLQHRMSNGRMYLALGDSSD
jgi:hypothetical protein